MAIASDGALAGGNFSAVTSKATGNLSVTVGHTLILMLDFSVNTISVNSVTDTLGNVWVRGGRSTSGTDVAVEVWYCFSCVSTSATCNVTANFSASATGNFEASSYSGVLSIAQSKTITGNGTTVSLAITFGTTGNWLVSCLAAAATGTMTVTNGTSRATRTAASPEFNDMDTAGAGSTTSYTIAAAVDFAGVGIELSVAPFYAYDEPDQQFPRSVVPDLSAPDPDSIRVVAAVGAPTQSFDHDADGQLNTQTWTPFDYADDAHLQVFVAQVWDMDEHQMWTQTWVKDDEQDYTTIQIFVTQAFDDDTQWPQQPQMFKQEYEDASYFPIVPTVLISAFDDDTQLPWPTAVDYNYPDDPNFPVVVMQSFDTDADSQIFNGAYNVGTSFDYTDVAIIVVVVAGPTTLPWIASWLASSGKRRGGL